MDGYHAAAKCGAHQTARPQDVRRGGIPAIRARLGRRRSSLDRSRHAWRFATRGWSRGERGEVLAIRFAVGEPALWAPLLAEIAARRHCLAQQREAPPWPGTVTRKATSSSTSPVRELTG